MVVWYLPLVIVSQVFVFHYQVSFLLTLPFDCSGKVRPFHQLLDEVERTGEIFFHGLARVISEGRVLRYIDYQAEIPRKV
jgi:hypothetical protein